MTLSLFCSNNHLVLGAPRCSKCDWVRPPVVNFGETVWGPIEFVAGLGGPGRSVFARLASAQGVVVLPLRNGELVGVDLNTGDIRWRTDPQPGQVTRLLVADDNTRLLLSLADERPIEQASAGQLAALDPRSGKLTTLWQSDHSQISPPALTDEFILLRIHAELCVLRRQAQPSIVWRTELRSWWALQPAVFGETVLLSDGNPAQGENLLCAFSLLDGQPLWETPMDGMLAYPPVRVGKAIIVRNGRQGLIGVDIASGEVLWRRKYSQIYSGLQVGEGHVYLVIRGPAPAGESGHYLLQALDPIANQVVWESPLPGRARVTQLLNENTLLLGDDDGRLLACETMQGKLLWEYRLGSDENPIHTGLLVANGFLIAGTYYGRVVALQVRTVPKLENPEDYLQHGEVHLAAWAYAMQGDYRRSAEIYAQDLKETEKALLLYEHGELYAEAGQLALSQRWYERALECFERTGNLEAQAEVFLQWGKKAEAARKLEQAGRLAEAAALYEEVGDLSNALELYLRLGDTAGVSRIRKRLPPNLIVIEYLYNQHRLPEAGELAFEAGFYDRAAEIFKEADLPEREFDALLKMIQASPERWALERLSTLARSLGRFREEAEARVQLNQSPKAAEAYHRAARQAEQVNHEGEANIAGLYSKAAEYYSEAGVEAEARLCQAKVVEYRHLPLIVVSGQTSKAFREAEHNTLDLVIQNVGNGVAHEVCVQIGGSRFEIDEDTCMITIKRLAPRHERQERIFLRPLEEQVGPAVPLRLELSWRDRDNLSYHDHITTAVPVKSKDDSIIGSSPVVIHAQTFVHGTFVSGDQIAGDVIEGDQIREGAQKGDRVEIRRQGVGLRMAESTVAPPDERPVSLCPNCHLPVLADDPYCQECGRSLKPSGAGKAENTP